MKFPIKYILSALLLCLALPAYGEVLEVSDEEMHMLGIELQAVTSTSGGHTGELSLRVAFSPDGEWVVKTPVAGLLHRVYVKVGDGVHAGDPLVTIRSPEVVQLQRDFLKAKAELNLQDAARERDRKLNEAGSISGRRWQETGYAWETARAEYAGLRAQLKLAGFSDDDLDALLSARREISPDVTLRAPVDALVLERPAMLGDHLEGTELLARLGEPGSLVLEGTLPLSAAARLREGDLIRQQNGTGEATLVFVSSFIDAESQTMKVRAEPRHPEALHPGQLTRWNVVAGEAVLILPSSAVVRLDDSDRVYVRVAGGFEDRPVVVNSAGGGNWIVLEGLSAGEQVAVTGTAALKGMSVGMGGGDG